MEEVAEVEGEVVEVVGVVVEGHLEDLTQADDHLATKVIGAEFTTIIEAVPHI